jgi:hypothetical protein
MCRPAAFVFPSDIYPFPKKPKDEYPVLHRAILPTFGLNIGAELFTLTPHNS